MGFVQNRVAGDRSSPPSLYGADGVEAPVSASARWHDRVDVAIVGGGITGLWTAYHLAAAGVQTALLEAHEIGHGASGRAFGQLVPYLKHDHRKIAADFGPGRGQALSDAVAAAPTEIAAFIERHQIACAATRSGILIGARSEAGRHWLEQIASEQPDARMLHGADAAHRVGSEFYDAVLLDPRGLHVDPLAYARGLAHVAKAHGALIHPQTRVEAVARSGSAWELRCGHRRLTADSVVIATNAYSGDFWPKLARSIVPFLVHGAVTEPLSDAALARILPEGQPLTDTRRLYSGVRKFGKRLHVSIDGASFAPGRSDPQLMVRKRLGELYPWLPTPRVTESWSGWIALTTDQYPHIHALADRVFAGIGCNGRGLAMASLLGRDLAHLARGGSEADTIFPVTPLRSLPLHDAAALIVAIAASAKRWLDRIDSARH